MIFWKGFGSCGFEKKGERGEEWSTSFIDEVIFGRVLIVVTLRKGEEEGRKEWSTSFIRRSDFLKVVLVAVVLRKEGEGVDTNRNSKPKGRCWIRQEKNPPRIEYLGGTLEC